MGGAQIDGLQPTARASYIDHDGYLDNVYLNEKADPYQDQSIRGRINWQVNDRLSTDFRASYSSLDTQAFYFVLDDSADAVDKPIQNNNPGNNERDFTSASFKFDYELDGATLTGITSYDDVSEISSGDNVFFLPPEHPENYWNYDFFFGCLREGQTNPACAFLGPFPGTQDDYIDLSQNQYLEVESWSQELRLTSNNEDGLRWTVGAYAVMTDRYISTGGQIDRGLGVFDVERDFRPSIFTDGYADGVVNDPSPQLGVLADSQDNFAWAVFGQVSWDASENVEVALSARYDRDTRENTRLLRLSTTCLSMRQLCTAISARKHGVPSSLRQPSAGCLMTTGSFMQMPAAASEAVALTKRA